MMPTPYSTIKAKRSAQSRRRNEGQRQWEQAHKEAMERYVADRKAAIANGTKLPNFGEYMPANNF